MTDLRYAVRMLRKNVGFTGVAVVTLALGIGATTAIFSVVDTVVFRSLPYDEPDRLLKICGTGPRDRACDDDFSLREFETIRERRDIFAAVAADDGMGVTVIRADGRREPLGVGFVTANWLGALGVRPLLGRDFTADEAQPGANGVVILMHDYWRRRFNSDPHVLGQTIAFDGVTHTVIGVMQANVLRNYADVLKPLVAAGYSDRSLDVIGRLKPGMSLEQTRAGMEILGARLEQQYPETNKGRRLSARALGKDYASIDGDSSRSLILMLGAVAIVLVIACTNVANLLLARAGVRRRESVIRAALGASRVRLVRQFLVESLLLFVAGGALGVAVATLSLDWLTALAVSGGYLPERMAVAVDLRILGISLLLTLLTGVAFGLIPAVLASKVDLNAGLRDSTQTLTGDRRRGRSRRLLIIAEVALSLVLLAGFGLLIRSFARIYAESGGFDPEHVVVTGSDGGRSFPEAIAFWRAALDRARAIPGVTSAAVTSRPPLNGARSKPFIAEGRPLASPDEASQAGDLLVSDDYFRTLRIPLVKGRAFTAEDNERSQPVAIISQSLASRYFGDEEPVGRRISLQERSPMTCCTAPAAVENVWREIVGVAGDVRQANLDDAPALTVYRPYAQIIEHDMFMVLRAASAADASRVTLELRARLTDVDPSRDWWDPRSMATVIRDSGSIRLRRFVLILLGSFAAIALALAAVGIYGVASSLVGERTREIGVRIALGATRPAVFRQVLGEMLAVAAAGVALGCAGALLVTRLIRNMLFGVSATDGVTYLAVGLLIGGVVLLAAWIPARRAMRIDPMVALRTE